MKHAPILSLSVFLAASAATSVSATIMMTPVQNGTFGSSSDGTYTDFAFGPTILAGKTKSAALRNSIHH
jgi:hypothetical protein|tara:strand:- start:183 stop:389 length:207 start_codon:yes stop_codon:yes gene_type:complete